MMSYLPPPFSGCSSMKSNGLTLREINWLNFGTSSMTQKLE
ncbi:hypothetical protein AZ22_4067 [Bordetella bronchiseptica 980-2]|nr:hypothetical protein AZ22_4067 [Bordetella bronchiseptica 980-2]KCV27473.1 hypothetical protein L489_4558 [Bordetella bronchiseptica 00-P-2730]KCV51898.1 hypothetical protein L491_4247 [Bordetella bronchiseptica 3E44]KCV62335.1 hypothetical protein AZ14_4305 [Bordetella bronchiseptica 980]KDB86866.1 hypothetical protein AZ27_4136 [Bordetella bronchiseptica D756]KDB90735.1 hypothetical protein AZ17_4329 [Bordetella bronchiseptica D989]KDD50078.1 hypothetical protein L533_4472 [Bordetella br